MSQNPDGTPNYNPYEQNPGPPYYHGAQPPAGSQPSYPPYSNPDPNTPNSRYGPYDNAYAPPPPPGSGAGLYNPYDASAETVISSRPHPGPTYPTYTPLPTSPTGTPMPQPQPPSKRDRTILVSIIILLLILGGSVFGVVVYKNSHTQGPGSSTQTPSTGSPTTYPFSTNLVLNDPLTDNNHPEYGWDNVQSQGCSFSGSSYHISGAKNFYIFCSALKQNFSNFTFQGDITLRQGSATAKSGLIFRAAETNVQWYMFLIDQQGHYSFEVVSPTSDGHIQNNVLQSGVVAQYSGGISQTNTLAVVARDNQFSLYVDHQMIQSVSDPSNTYTSGQIGFIVTDPNAPSEISANNAMVWQL